jgi:hypothetical protein
MTKRWTLTAVVAMAVGSVTACGGSEGDPPVVGGVPSVESVASTQVVYPDSVADTSDIRNLVALSTHIFSGQVLAVAGTEALSASPETQFNVLTGLTLKGEVAKDVVVNQQGGTAGGVYISFDGDTPLVAGQWYLFATRILESKKWFTLIPVHGDVKITEEQARNVSSQPLAAVAAAIKDNPGGHLAPPSTQTSPPLTFPIPTPGEHHPPPPSPPQPTP